MSGRRPGRTAGVAEPRGGSPASRVLTRCGVTALLLAALVMAGPGCGGRRPASPQGDLLPPAAVNDLDATLVTSDRVLLTWTATGDDDTLGQASGYHIWYWIDPHSPTGGGSPVGELDSLPPPSRAGSRDSTIAGPLNPGRRYWFAVHVVDDAGHQSLTSNLATLLVPPDTTPPPPDITPPARIMDLAVHRVTNDSIELRWKAPGNDGVLGTAMSYDLRYRHDALTELTWDEATQVSNEPVPVRAGLEQGVLIEGLEAGRVYALAVVARDSAGNASPLSNVVSATTTVPRLWVVRADRSGDRPTIQAAIDASVDGDTVLVGPGISRETLDLGGRQILVRSERGRDQTTIDGSGIARSVVAFVNGETRQTIFQGFTVTGGRTGGGTSPGSRFDGGGMLIWLSSPVILECAIVDNAVTSASGYGGGIALAGPRSGPGIEPEFRDCLIARNTARCCGGGMNAGGAMSLLLENCEFRGNSTTECDGGAIYAGVSDGSLTLRNCRILDNSAYDKAGGVFIYRSSGLPSSGSGTLVISGCVFRGNRARAIPQVTYGGGALICHNIRGRVEQSTFAGNRCDPGAGERRGSDWGGAIAVQTCPDLVIERNIIAFQSSGGGLFCSDTSKPQIRDNLFWSNVGSLPDRHLTGSCGTPDVLARNTVADPLFCDPTFQDVGVAANSPALSLPGGVRGAVEAPGCPAR